MTLDPKWEGGETSVDLDPLWYTDQVSKVTGVPVATLRWWRSKGIGPASFRLGQRKIVYRRSVVLAWIDEQEARGA